MAAKLSIPYVPATAVPIPYVPQTPQIPDPLPGPGTVAQIPGQQSGGGIPVPSFIPPNGFAGLAQQTPAVQSIYRRGRSSGGVRRRRRRGKATAARRRRRAAAGKRGGKFVKGSAAAKRHMAKLRRMRRK